MKDLAGKIKASKPAAKITTLAGLRAVLEAPLTARFQIDGQVVELKVKRISAAVDEARREILRTPIPPWDKTRNNGQGDYDLLAPAYRKARELAEDQARSYVVYHCFPEVQAAAPGLVDGPAIHAHVKAMLPPLLQETIALTALAGGFGPEEVDQRANFTLPGASES